MQPKLLTLFLFVSILACSSAIAQTDTTVSIAKPRTGHWHVRINAHQPVNDPDNPGRFMLPVTGNAGITFRLNPRDSAAAELILKIGSDTLTDQKAAAGQPLVYSIGSNLRIGGSSIANTNLRAIIHFKPATGTSLDTLIDFTVTNAVPATAIASPAGNTPAPGSIPPAGNASDSIRFYLPGDIYYDALTLANPKLSTQEWDNILRFYKVVAPNALHGDIVGTIPNWTNPFLKDVFKSLAAVPANDFTKNHPASRLSTLAQAQATSTAIQSLIGSVSSLGGLDVTNIADGVAKFLVDRAKQELTLTFFVKLDSLLKNPKLVDLGTLFPRTDSLLLAMGDQIYDYNRYMQNLSSAFKADLKALPADLPGIIPNHPTYFKLHPTWAASLRTACYLADGLEKKTHPGDMLSLFPLSDLDGMPDSTDLKAGVHILQILSASLKDTISGSTANYWVNIGQVRSLVSNKQTFELFLGLIYQKMVNGDWQVKFSNNDSLSRLMDTLGVHYSDYYDAYSKFVLGIGVQTDALEKLIHSADDATSDSAKAQLYAAYARQTVTLLQTTATVFTLPLIKDLFPNPAWLKKVNQYFSLSYEVADLASDIGKKDYSGAINQTVRIYSDWIHLPPDIAVNKTAAIPAAYVTFADQLAEAAGAAPGDASVQKALTDLLKPVIPAPAAAVAPALDPFQSFVDSLVKKYTAAVITPAIQAQLRTAYNAVTNDATWKQKQQDSVKAIAARQTQTLADSLHATVSGGTSVKSNLIFYGGFIAAMVTAKTSDEVEKVLETYALPAGSSRVKRESPFNVSLNGYLGFYYGHEAVSGINDKLAFNSYGVTAPIGVAISRGHSIFFLGTGPTGWKQNKKGWSSTLFISIFDLGAIASYRVSNDTVAQIPTVQLKDIFSPGAFISLGIPKAPVSISFGAQFGPNLRNVTSAKNTYEDKTYVRYSAAVLVDIPLLNLSTKTRNADDQPAPPKEHKHKFLFWSW